MAGTVWHDKGGAATIPDDELRQAALAMLEARRAMRGTLPEHLIHDTALEQLLSVYLTDGTGVPVDQLLAEAAVSVDLARRWLDAIVSEGLLTLSDGAVSLTAVGLARMADMISSVVQSQRNLLGWATH